MRETLKFMAIGFVIALIMIAPGIAYYYNKDWEWARFLPFRLMYLSLGGMVTLFHELGHCLVSLFYGLIAIPAFDLVHGGGVTLPLTPPLFILHLALYGALIYGVLHFREKRSIQLPLVIIGVFHLATAHNVVHEILILFGGHVAELLIAAFLLWRAWFDRAPRGAMERYLNAAFGFAIVFNALVLGSALLQDDVVRQYYLEQKGGHSMGDFDRIADKTNTDFSTWIGLWLFLSVAAMAGPSLYYFQSRKSFHYA